MDYDIQYAYPMGIRQFVENTPESNADSLFEYLRDNWRTAQKGIDGVYQSQTEMFNDWFRNCEERRREFEDNQQSYGYRFYSRFLSHRD